MSVSLQQPETHGKFRDVPEDLLDGSSLRKFHSWKAAAVVRACVPFSRCLRAPKAELPGILMYHRVVHESRGCTPTWNVTPKRFRQQLTGLLQLGYTPWHLRRLISAVQKGDAIPDNVFVVTFDDGYANNLQFALQILEDLEVPATIFLATGYLDSPNPFPFDDWPLKGRADVPQETWRALTTAECHKMLDSDFIEFGSHTHTHEDFRNRPKAFQDSLLTSAEFLLHEFGIKNPTLSLPYGIVDRGFAGPKYFASAESIGMQCCLTTEEELLTPNSSPFGWGRFIAEQHDTADTLAVKLGGWRDAVRDTYRRVRGKS